MFEGGNIKEGDVEESGDVEAGFKAAAHIVEASYSTQVQTHVCLETKGTVCEWEGDKLTAWVSTQAVHGSREAFAEALGIPQANVRVICEYMGGGFGSKFGPDAQGIICAKLAKEAKAPVKLMLDRKEEHLAGGNRPSSGSKIKAGVAADGTLTAFDAESWGTGGAGVGAGFPLPYIYTFPNRRRKHRDVYTNAGPARAMRAPGHPQGCFATEMLMDELADKVRMDPVAFRLKNLPAEAPNKAWRKYFPIAAEKAGWTKRHPTGDPTPGPIKRGMGCAANQWGGGGRGTKAHVEILPDGGVVVRCGTQDLGTGCRTIVTMVAAETLGLPVAAVKAEIGDSQLSLQRRQRRQHDDGVGDPGDPRHERQGARRARRAHRAEDGRRARGARREGRPHLPQGRARQGPVVEGGLPAARHRAGVGRRRVGGGAVGERHERRPDRRGVGGHRDRHHQGRSDRLRPGLRPRPRHEDRETQCYGGIIMGVNWALFEDRILDRNTGQMVNPNMEWYLLGGMSDIPEIDVTLVNQPERGVIGIGEPPTISTAAAIANAVANAIGVRIRSLPLTPDKVLNALAQQRAGGTL